MSSILISPLWPSAMRAMRPTAAWRTAQRLQAYEDIAGVDWVQFESPHSVEEIQQARARVAGPLSFMRGKLPRYLSLDEHQALGVHIAWYPSFTHEVMYAALWDFAGLSDARPGGGEAFQASRQGRPYPHPLRLDVGETVATQRALEERYLSPSGLAKYQRAPGPSHRVITREERGWHATGIRFSTPIHMWDRRPRSSRGT